MGALPNVADTKDNNTYNSFDFSQGLRVTSCPKRQWKYIKGTPPNESAPTPQNNASSWVLLLDNRTTSETDPQTVASFLIRSLWM